MTSEFAWDVATGMPTLGIPEAYHIAEAIYYDDKEALAYHLKVMATVHGIWYTGYQLAKMYEMVVKGRVLGMSFHTAMSHKGALFAQIFKHPLFLLPASTAAQVIVWDKIGDSKTGAVHYAGGGAMSGGTMPVITGDGGDHTTWFPELRKWFN